MIFFIYRKAAIAKVSLVSKTHDVVRLQDKFT